jgi:endonuclease YncB( thermonuclease family)
MTKYGFLLVNRRSIHAMASMRFLLILPLLLLAFTPARADDADTLTVSGTPYRLDGIDAPEIDQNCMDEGGVYPCGQFAFEALQEFVAERPIRCDDLGPDTKYPRRRIGHCTRDGDDLHHWLVRNGWALTFEPYANGRFKDDERYAQQQGLGMWKGCFVAPRDFRRWNKHTATLLAPIVRPTLAAGSFRITPSCRPDARSRANTPSARC